MGSKTRLRRYLTANKAAHERAHWRREQSAHQRGLGRAPQSPLPRCVAGVQPDGAGGSQAAYGGRALHDFARYGDAYLVGLFQADVLGEPLRVHILE